MRGKFQKIAVIFGSFVLASIVPVFAGPTSTNYELRQYSFGPGGSDEASSSSSNFKLYGTIGETEGGTGTSTNFTVGQGFNYTLQAHVPPAPDVTNPDSSYNKLKLIITQSADDTAQTQYASAISPDNFASTTHYIQNDGTVGSTLGNEDWQTYTNWGGASGINIVGLSAGTTYTVKVMSRQGSFTQTGFGPTVQSSTTNPTLNFDIDVAATDTESLPPYSLDIGILTPGNITTPSSKVWVDIDTNLSGGAMIYVSGSNNGLFSTSAGYTINSVTSNLVSLDEGYGLRGTFVDQTSGGPMQVTAPFNGVGNNVGGTGTEPKLIFDSNSQGVTGGRTSFEIQAKASQLTKAGEDYNDILTIIVAASY
jgi:hypothetical protein